MTALANQISLKNGALLYIATPEDMETFRQYQINQKAENTIMIYRKRKVVDKFVNYDLTNPQTLLTRLEL